jgi:hypothetical protein
LEAKADFIVSTDPRPRNLQEYQGTEIVDVKTFVEKAKRGVAEIRPNRDCAFKTKLVLPSTRAQADGSAVEGYGAQFVRKNRRSDQKMISRGENVGLEENDTGALKAV